MAVNKTSYKSPYYLQLASRVEQQFKLPSGLLESIVRKGERSNADQVSSAGARTVAQIIPATRKAAMDKWGIDPWLSPENAMHVAGRLLKESLDRNGGDVEAAIGEYHGGPDRKRWGPINRAYRKRVLSGMGGATAPESFGRRTHPHRAPRSQGGIGSTFSRLRERDREQQEQGPSIASVYEAYRGGRMKPAEAAQFEEDVQAGAIILPRGATVRKREEVPYLPGTVVAAYNSGQMPEEERAQLESDVKEGLVRLPARETLKDPAQRTALQRLHMIAGDVATGVGDVLDMVNMANPVGFGNSMAQAMTEPMLYNQLVEQFGQEKADQAWPQVRERAFGKPVAETVRETVGAPEPVTANERLASSMVRGGTAGALFGVPAGARAVVADTIIGTTSGAGMEVGREMGGEPGAVAGALFGGGFGAGGVAATRRAFAGRRLPRATPETANTVADDVADNHPRASLFDEAGELTPNGAEVAARVNLEPGQLMAAYRRQSGRTRAAPEEPQPVRPANDDLPVQAIDEAPPVRAREPEAPAPVVAPVVADDAAAAVEAPAARAPSGTEPPNPPPPGVTPAFAEAEAESVKLTRGQAEQDFSIQNDEQSLKVANTAEGEQARQFFGEQQDQIKEAVGRFREGFGDTTLTPELRGTQVKEAIADLRDRGQAGVTALYRQAEAMGGSGLKLTTEPIVESAKRALVEADVPDQVKGVIRQEMARYGLMGKAEATAEDGLTTVKLSDGRKVQFYGEPEELTVANADAFRKAISAQYMADGPRKLSQQIKTAIDDATEEAMTSAAAGETTGQVAEAYKGARAAHVEQQRTFKAKDVIERLIAFKKGTKTDVVLPERAIAEVLGSGPEGVTNLRKVKAILLNKPTEQSRQAWRAIQAQGVANIFESAVNIQNQTISGARLNTAVAKFGENKLKVLIEEGEFNQLMKLRRIIGNATIPMSGTVNPSGTFTKLVNWFSQGALRFVPFGGQIGEMGSALIGKAKEIAKTKQTLAGIKDYDGRVETATRFDQQARELIQQYIAAGGSGRLLPIELQVEAAVQD